ncbi:hypothetical protein FQZ97_1054230 [compost metagenome]
MHRLRLAEGGGGHLGQSQRAHLARAHQVAHRAHAVFHRHLLVPAVQVVEVDHVGFEAAQAVFAIPADGLRPAVDHALHAVVELHAGHAALAGQREFAAVLREHVAHMRFAGAETVQGGGVEVRHTLVERSEQHALGLLLRHRRAVSVADVHAAQANGTDLEGAELSLLH